MNLVTLFVWMVDLGDCFIFNLPHYCFIEQFLVGMLYKVANGGLFRQLEFVLFIHQLFGPKQHGLDHFALSCLVSSRVQRRVFEVFLSGQQPQIFSTCIIWSSWIAVKNIQLVMFAGQHVASKELSMLLFLWT